MLVAERYDKIVSLVNERGSIRVSELSELCGVTEETIRRDLDRLEQQGKLRRSHGGAVSVKETQAETPYFEREVMHQEEKKRIAKAAVALIEPHDRIALDASSTAWYMASILPDIPLTVLTNSIKVALELSSKEKIEVISTGGILAARSLSYVGPMAERSLEAYYVEKAFVSCKGVHPERGISESNELQAMVKHKLIKQAANVYLLADASKIGVQAFTHVAGWEEIDTVITDSHIAGTDARLLREKGIELIVAE
ncbi:MULTISPECIES: DeoR/GlpR family DNA-binding transcription regulator [Paenibacillus]|uniref:HTH-type transcriptional regulator YulB n=1 Tax=Paenibacillus albilobatus TaxID=2716884 RepID=A0A920C8G6_9BACL|nr:MULTISPECIES: DeoR/GlpR family DNA-binding transcription regulator [Paenibacillus]MDR9854456.1 DeoR/GlpR family DNA-binding transcription regulator [Paenibacillus sp. VCA1]GIO30086.1 putative HTH-type transcriptional regulator YulB [Paenibacillus albilobatus]